MSVASSAPPRRQRADAKQNVDALIEAAKAVFERSGVDAPAKEITDAAGVGVGTLYRHFPRRSDLIVAVLQHELDDCINEATRLLDSPDPWTAVLEWIDRFTAFVGTKRGLATALHSGDAAYDGLGSRLLDRLVPSMDALLIRAADEGSARSDVAARDVLTTVALICHPVPGADPAFAERMVHVFTEGLRRG